MQKTMMLPVEPLTLNNKTNPRQEKETQGNLKAPDNCLGQLNWIRTTALLEKMRWPHDPRLILSPNPR